MAEGAASQKRCNPSGDGRRGSVRYTKGRKHVEKQRWGDRGPVQKVPALSIKH